MWLVVKNILLVLVLIVATLFLFLVIQLAQMGPGSMDSDDPQITLVNRLLPQHEIEVLESFTMRGNWSGDVEKGFVAEIDIDESFLEHWVEAQRGDRLTPARVDAVLFVTEWFGNGQLDWFPPAADFLSADFYYLPVKVNQGVDYIDDSKLVFINPSTNKLYFSWVVF